MAKRAELKLVEKSDEPTNPHKLEAPYTYFTEDNVMRSWAPGQVIHDPEEISHLKERGARLIEMKP